MKRVWNLLALNRERDQLADKSSASDVIKTMLTMNEEQKLKFCYALWFYQPDVVEASLNHKQRASRLFPSSKISPSLPFFFLALES